MLASPNDPSPRRLSGELGRGFWTLRGHGSLCVAGSMKCATRVLTRIDPSEFAQTRSSLFQALLKPSPTNSRFTGGPLDIPAEASVATRAQSVWAFSAASRGYHASVIAAIVFAIWLTCAFVNCGPLFVHEAGVTNSFAPARLAACWSLASAASRIRRRSA